MSHLNCLFPSWSAATWVFKLPFCSKLALQMSHLNCFFPSWTVAICVFKWPLCPKLQKSHLNCFFPLWTVAMKKTQLTHFLSLSGRVSLEKKKNVR